MDDIPEEKQITDELLRQSTTQNLILQVQSKCLCEYN